MAEVPRIDRAPWRLLILLGLTGFAISQPLLSIAGANPTLFVFNDVGRFTMVAGAVLIALVPPLVLWLATQGIARIDQRAGHTAFLAISAGLLLLAGVQFGRELGLGIASILLGLALAGGGVTALLRVPAVAEWMGVAAVLPVLALGLFLFTSDSSDLLANPGQAERTAVAGAGSSLVFVLFDELPTLTLLDEQGMIDEEAFPNFHRLGEGSTWYRNFTTMTATTSNAVPAMLSGVVPREGQPLWTSYPDNLFSLLAPTHGFTVDESFTRLCGTSSCTNAGPDSESASGSRLGKAAEQLVDLWVDRIRGREGVSLQLDDFVEEFEVEDDDEGGMAEALFPDDATVRRNPERLTRFVDAIAETSRPHLYFLHLVLPHIPFRWYADGTQYASEPDPLTTAFLGREVEWLAALDEQRHILQAQYTDRLLGQILDALEAADIYDETAVVVASDHGMAFEIGEDRRSMDPGGRNGTAYVPVLVKSPGQREARIDDANLMTPDLLPLIADAVGVEITFDVDGALAGTPEVEGRGSQKTYIPVIGGLASKELGDAVTFDILDNPLGVEDRRLNPASPSENEMAPLLSLLESSDLIGGPLITDLSAPVATVEIMALEDIESPVTAPDGTVTAFVQGIVTSGPPATEVVIAADGRVVSGSAVFETAEGPAFAAMLPRNVAGAGFDLEVGLLTEDGIMAPTDIDAG